MSGKPKNKVPLLAAVALSAISVAGVGCGKSSSAAQSSAATSTTQTAAQTTPKQLTYAQTITNGDAACTAVIKQVDPLVKQMSAIQKSGASTVIINKRTGPLVESIAGGTRSVGRQLQELRPPASYLRVLQNFASGLIELAVLEEQLSQALRANETSRIPEVSPEVERIRAGAIGSAKSIGFRVCGASTHTPVG